MSTSTLGGHVNTTPASCRWPSAPSCAQRPIQGQRCCRMPAHGRVNRRSGDGPWREREPAAPLGQGDRERHGGARGSSATGTPIGSPIGHRVRAAATAAKRCIACAGDPHRTAPRCDSDLGDVAQRCSRRMRRLDARAAAMIRIDAMWLAVEPADMRAGADRLLARVVQVFGSAQAHHGNLFANGRGTRIKLVVHDGSAVDCPGAPLPRKPSPGFPGAPMSRQSLHPCRVGPRASTPSCPPATPCVRSARQLRGSAPGRTFAVDAGCFTSVPPCRPKVLTRPSGAADTVSLWQFHPAALWRGLNSMPAVRGRRYHTRKRRRTCP